MAVVPASSLKVIFVAAPPEDEMVIVDPAGVIVIFAPATNVPKTGSAPAPCPRSIDPSAPGPALPIGAVPSPNITV